MLIAGALVEYDKNFNEKVLDLLRREENLTFYETEKAGKVVIVIEAQDTNILEEQIKELEGLNEIIGVFPSYINYEEEFSKNQTKEQFLN
ncbi:chaperone NapD [Selenihalanaerobacter shriftii]|uniref:Periplasmic nitrate reductase chaperone NapD n=1 Tax=Selenihalanaerobacter shriftii TaxID=142842 RepID=A0A1T4PN62_9FIRM|nr:chaperone NapD [Selenihalanaerobacter shriftii]SJZ92706.1 periplasmic nitrate reductase chaperone NapD [Selenihalanaerobacter shriftii]